jgi:arylformamidase
VSQALHIPDGKLVSPEALVPVPAASATPEGRPKGPLVWLDMDQQALDDAYDQAKYAANRDQLNSRRGSLSKTARENLGEPQRFAYGPTEIEKLDVYRARNANAPVMVFIHGGAWRRGQAKNFAFPAELFVNAGAHFVVPDFNNVIETGGDLVPMAEQVRRAIAWTYRNAASFGGDANRLYVSAHSSGSHLAGCAVVADWAKEGLPNGFIKGALLACGMYDLKPVRMSKRSEYVKFTDAMEQDLSSQRYLDRLHTPLVVAHGTYETPEFQRQARDFHTAVTAAGKPCELLVGEGFNHFEMLETLANPYGLLGRAALKMMGLPAT